MGEIILERIAFGNAVTSILWLLGDYAKERMEISTTPNIHLLDMPPKLKQTIVSIGSTWAKILGMWDIVGSTPS